MRKETDLDGVKAIAKALLMTAVNETPYSPMIVQHPFTSTGLVALPTEMNKGFQPVDITLNEDNLKIWRESVSQIIDEAENPYHIYKLTVVYTDGECSTNFEVKQAATPTGGKEIPVVEIINATLDYNVGEAPQATAQVTGDAAEHCEIEYECWEEIDENGKPLAFWYSDESQYNPNMQKITAFEAGKTYTYSLVVKAEKGYVFGDRATLKINDNVVSDPIIMNPPLFPEARIVGEQIKTVALPYYQVIEGANGVWTKNSDKTLVFRANGDFSKFTGVKVDDTLIDAKNYTAVSGSTVITLKADYLQTLSVGTHKLTVVYTDGECSTNFEVKQATTPTGGKDTTSPQTGDNSHIYPFAFSHHGELPAAAEIRIRVADQYAGKQVYVYYLDEDNQPQQAAVATVTEDAFLTFSTDHCSLWFVSEQMVVPQTQSGSPVWIWILCGVGAAAVLAGAAVVMIILLKRRVQKAD